VRVKDGRDHLSWVTAASLVLFVLLLWFNAAPLGNIHTGDTDNLVVGTRRALACLGAGTWSECGLHKGAPVSEVFPYPALQYIPAAAFVASGRSDAAVVEALARLNIIAFAATIALCAWTFSSSERRASRALAIIAVIASTAVYHSTAGFGEMLAATVVVAAVGACIKRRPLLILVTVALSAIAKDTLLPFVATLGFLCAREPGRWTPPRRVVVALCVGAIAGAALIAGFNQFRFGQAMNTFYLQPLFRTPGLGRILIFLAAGWLSPSAGLLFYWPIATVSIFLCTALAVVNLLRQPARLESWAPGLAVALLAVGFTAGLAAWFSPYGWIAYGPRLAVPLIPGLVIAALHLAGAPLEAFVRRLLRPAAGLAIVAALIVAAGWPQFGSAWSYGPAIQDLIAGDSTCPHMMDTTIEKDPALYYTCTEHRMWRLHALPIDEAASEGGSVALIGRLLLATATITLLAAVRTASDET
jgi:hypothetical protein